MGDATLELNPDTVCFIITKIHEFQAKEQVVPSEESYSLGDDWRHQVLADDHEDLTYMELKMAINDLEPDQQCSLVALMWLGRGDFDVSEWEAAMKEARERWTHHTAEYLTGTPLVADYLLEGLSLLGRSCE
jgi:thiamine biosynthesis protein ThiC